MEVFFIKTVQFLLALSILVVLHEGGHFFFAKLFGTRVTRFYLFANYKFHLFSSYDDWFRRLLGKPLIKERDNEGIHFGQQVRNLYYKLTRQPEKIRTENVGNRIYDDQYGTEYGIGWLPLGGYCQISGMVDETQSAKDMANSEPQPWEFRSKPAWQRLLIMIGGVSVNLVSAFIIYAMVLFTWGDSYVPVQSYSEGMAFNERAKEIGFCDGDVLLATEKGTIDARKTADLFRTVADAKEVTVRRGGQEVKIAMPAELSLLDMVNEVPQFMEMLVPNVVDSVIPGMPAELAGLRAGDRLLALNGYPITNHNQFLNEVARINDQTLDCSAEDSLRLRHISVVIERQTVRDTLQVVMTPDFKMGFTPKLPDYEVVNLEYGFFESLPAGVAYGWDVLCGYVGDLKYVFTKQGAKSVGGFATIGSIFPAAWNWHAFWMMTALLSVILAFMNILPIPALDGGHVLFLLYEVVTRRTPSEKFMERAQMVGMGLLLILMLWANLNDVIRFLF